MVANRSEGDAAIVANLIRDARFFPRVAQWVDGGAETQKGCAFAGQMVYISSDFSQLAHASPVVDDVLFKDQDCASRGVFTCFSFQDHVLKIISNFEFDNDVCFARRFQ